MSEMNEESSSHGDNLGHREIAINSKGKCRFLIKTRLGQHMFCFVSARFTQFSYLHWIRSGDAFQNTPQFFIFSIL